MFAQKKLGYSFSLRWESFFFFFEVTVKQFIYFIIAKRKTFESVKFPFGAMAKLNTAKAEIFGTTK